MNIAELWNISIGLMYDEKYVKSLDSFLKQKGVKTIIDVSGGTGFPSLELKKLGWNITYSDGNEVMFKFFKDKLSNSKIKMPYYLINWLELSQRINQKFDVCLCRGNSLIYVDSWVKDNVPKEAKNNIKKSLMEFYKILKIGGFLYVDLTNEKEFNKLEYPITEDFGEIVLDNKKINLKWEIYHDYKKRIRKINNLVDVNGKKQELVYSSYLLKHEELINMLREVGFKKIEKLNLDGENNYNVFIAYK